MLHSSRLMKILTVLSVLTLVLISRAPLALELKAIDYNVLPGDRVQVRLQMDGVPAIPKEFTTENPARIALDFVGVSSSLGRKTLNIGIGNARSVTAVSAQGRTRVVINLVALESYTTSVEGGDFYIMLGESSGSSNVAATTAAPSFSGTAEVSAMPQPTGTTSVVDSRFNNITEVDFRRGRNGEGRVVLRLTKPNAPIDLRQEGNKIIAEFMDARIPQGLIRRVDVVDFATPAQIIDTSQQANSVKLEIEAGGDFEHIGYQADDLFTVELKPLTDDELEQRKKDTKFKYSGDKLSFSFQDISVRGVIMLLADFTGLNMVVSDSVTGNITLRLQNVPWDQALDIVLKTKGLDQRRSGDVILIAPANEIAAREKAELQAQQSVQKLAPLRSEFIQVNYAKAQDLVALLNAGETSLLSERGSVGVDERTNTLLVQDTADKLEEVRELVRRLDIPVRQVLIESRIVTANDEFDESMGVRFGVSDQGSEFGASGTLEGAESVRETGDAPLGQRLNVNLPIVGTGGSIGFNVARLTDGTILDLELSALETENRGEVIASPRVITANQREAYIEQGVEIPFQTLTAAGGGTTANIEFKKAVLSLRVTPQITPDDRIIIDLVVNQDTQGVDTAAGPAINTQEIGTQVLVDNGETVVLGGIYQRELGKTINKVPVLGDLPVVGWLFKNTTGTDDKRELLIFVTPKIL
ncbi:MAG: type IV pilus secretin PilQ [Pseudomonadota bacterium]